MEKNVSRTVNAAIAASFRSAYEQAVADVLRFFDAKKLALVARHNSAWAPERFDVGYYLSASHTRYHKALEVAQAHGFGDRAQSYVLDIGGFFAAFPLALARIGLNVTVAEKYSYYYGAFDDLREFLVKEGIKIWDEDLTQPASCDNREKFALVTNMAVIEHLAGSPKALMENSKNLLMDDGLLVLEVPNIAYWPNRLKMLRGESVLPDLRDVYDSDPPFLGHHREYTIKDVHQLMEWTNIDVIERVTYNYTPWPKGNWKQKILLEWPIRRFESCREIILACGRKRKNNVENKVV